MNILLLPDVIVLNIFSYLTVKELCKYSRVCKAWRRIACDKTLWKHIDMTKCETLNLRKVWKFYRTRLSDVLRSLKMIGYYSSNCSNEKQKKQLLSDALLEEIRTSCPFIEELHLNKFFLEKMSADKLPASLIHLKLRYCSWPLGWLHTVVLPDLRSLDLGRTSRIGDSEISDVVRFTGIEELNLEQLFRVTDVGVRTLAENLPKIKVLNLDGTKVSDLGLHHICRNMVNLVSLNVCHSHITDTGIENICNSLSSLHVLSISGTQITDIGVRTLCYSKIAQNITHLYASATKISDSSLNDISDKLINLEELDVGFCNVTLNTLNDMKQHLPKLRNIIMCQSNRFRH